MQSIGPFRPTRRAWLPPVLAAAAVIAVAGIAYLLHPGSALTPAVDLPPAKSDGPAMCPWRDPQGDLRAFFPGPSRYRTDTLALSSYRQDILKRLGPSGRIESNSLYVYRALRNDDVVGSVIVRRVPGPHGAIEVVAAVDPEGRIVGIRVQRNREPETIAPILTSPGFSRRFNGLTANTAPLELKGDLPLEARLPAAAVLRAVRSMLIELDEAERHYAGSPVRKHH